MKSFFARTFSNLLPPALYISCTLPALNFVEWTRIAPDTVVPTQASPPGKPRTSGSGTGSAAVAGGAARTRVAAATATGVTNRGNRTGAPRDTGCDPPGLGGCVNWAQNPLSERMSAHRLTMGL